MTIDSAKSAPGFVAVIDPPWSADAGGGGKGANEKYELADVSRIAEGYYGARDDKGARIWPALNTRDPMLVWMWATQGAMTIPDDPDEGVQPDFSGRTDVDAPDAYRLARLLAVRVATIFVWCKVDESEYTGVDYDTGEPYRLVSHPSRMGLGQRSRVEHEYLLCCVRNKVPLPTTDVRPRSVIYAPRGKHSEKPERAWSQVIDPVSRACMPGVVGVEINARVQRAGWAAVGRLDDEDGPISYRGAA